MVKLLVGLLKGAVIGAAVGYGALQLATATGFSNAWLTYGLIGAMVGLFVGKPLWSLLRDKNATNWIAVLKGLFGFGVGCGLYALFSKVVPTLHDHRGHHVAVAADPGRCDRRGLRRFCRARRLDRR